MFVSALLTLAADRSPQITPRTQYARAAAKLKVLQTTQLQSCALFRFSSCLSSARVLDICIIGFKKRKQIFRGTYLSSNCFSEADFLSINAPTCQREFYNGLLSLNIC
jgi:hypothetical protein